MTVIKRGSAKNKMNVYLINPGNIEQIWVGNSYIPDALKANNAKYVCEIECTTCLRNLLGGRMTPLTTEEIETEIKEITEYLENAKAIMETPGYNRTLGERGISEIERARNTIRDAEKYASEFEKLLKELTLVK